MKFKAKALWGAATLALMSAAPAMAQDVAAFLIWTAEPKLDKRKQTGWAVLGFLLAATVLAYLAKKNVWADQH